MKRFIITLLVAFSILHISAGQESSSDNNPYSHFIGEWTGTFKKQVHWGNGVYKNSQLVLRIESFGGKLEIRVKTKSFDNQNVSYRDWIIAKISSNTIQLIEKGPEFHNDDSDGDFWFWHTFHFRLTYDSGRLELSAEGADECRRYESFEKCYYNPNILGDFYDMYLYKNANNW